MSKYVGETSKNLGRILAEAESANTIFFFDEADALFGKLSEVKDAHDRYAFIKGGCLLQLMEAYDGVAVLTINFRRNLYQAFAQSWLHIRISLSYNYKRSLIHIVTALSLTVDPILALLLVINHLLRPELRTPTYCYF